MTCVYQKPVTYSNSYRRTVLPAKIMEYGGESLLKLDFIVSNLILTDITDFEGVLGAVCN